MACDQFFANVASLLHFDGADGSTAVTDETGKVWTAYGNAQIDTAFSQFGGSSLLLDGTGDYLSTPSSQDLDLGDTYTIEMFVNPQSLSANFGIVHRGYYTVGTQQWAGVLAFSARWIGSALRVYFYGTTNANEQYVDVAGLVAGVSKHLAIVRSGTVGKVYIGGTLVGTKTGLNTPAPSAEPLRIGVWDYSAGAEYFNGHIDELRITKGLARYTSDFTPPTIPFEGQCAVVGDVHYDKVELLLPFSGTDASTSFPDYGPVNMSMTPAGDARISTAVSKYYGSSLYLDGAGDYALTSASMVLGTADFTLEGWFYLTSTPVTNVDTLLCQSSIFNLEWTTAGKIGMYLHGPAVYDVGPTTLTAGAFHHVAVTRQSGVFKGWVGGVNQWSRAVAYSMGSAAFYVGFDPTVSTRDFGPGYVQDVRVTLGVARYTADFTPPGRLIAPIGGTILDDTGSAAVRNILAVPRVGGRVFKAVSAADGSYSLWVPTTEIARIALDDDAGAIYNDIVDRVLPV